MTALATGWDGARHATYPVDAVTMGGTDGEADATIVSGPGQKADVRARRARDSIDDGGDDSAEDSSSSSSSSAAVGDKEEQALHRFSASSSLVT
mmetsp:Transcript_28758/g.84830  ORF Transcript_28758/g.84830 Transcript_28758/m.84830 type:complete len:94 (-) Transcript_28758:234-515(-)